MKRDLKPFVVEVKRGTRRSSFLGQMDPSSTMSEAQRRAETALFAPAVEEAAIKSGGAEPSRRILRSLVEPASPPPVSDQETQYVAERRPRPVGRPRKPKPDARDIEPFLARPRFFEAPLPMTPAGAGAEVSAPPTLVAPPTPPLPPRPVTPVRVKQPEGFAPHVVGERPVAAAPVQAAIPPSGGRQRLRERSSILARYVLGTEPAPGERWSGFSRLAERRSRRSQ